MRRMGTRFSAILLIILFAGALFTGCNRGDSPAPLPSQLDIGVGLDIYSAENFNSDGYSNQFFDPILKELGIENQQSRYTNGLSGITGSLALSRDDRLLEHTIANDDAFTKDMFITFPAAIPFLKQKGLATDLMPLVSVNGLDMNEWEPSLVNLIKIFGEDPKKLYAIPFRRTIPLLFYKKKIFNDCHIPYPSNGMTWDDVLKTSRNILACSPNYTGLANELHDLMLIPSQRGLTLLDPKTGKAELGSKQWQDTFQFLRNLVQNNGGKGDATDYTNTAMIATADFKSGSLLDMNNWGAVSYPTFADNPGVAPVTTGLVIIINPKISKEKQQAAFDVAKKLISKDFQRQMARHKSLYRFYATMLTDKETRSDDGAFFMDESIKDALKTNKPAEIPSVNIIEAGSDGSLWRTVLNGGFLSRNKRMDEELILDMEKYVDDEEHKRIMNLDKGPETNGNP